MISPSKKIISSFLTKIGMKLVNICIIKLEFLTFLKILKPLITFEYILNNKSFFIASGTPLINKLIPIFFLFLKMVNK